MFLAVSITPKLLLNQTAGTVNPCLSQTLQQQQQEEGHF